VSGPRRVVIVANGVPANDIAVPPGEAGDLVIAADGGADLALAMGMVPAIVIGDMDSISADAARRLREAGAAFHPHPRDKNQTDLELALDLALQHAPSDITVLNAMGGRWDMSLANVLLLSSRRVLGVNITIVDGSQYIRLIADGQRIALTGRDGDTLSLIPLDPVITGVTVTGVAWPLTGEDLVRGQTRGVSNRFTSTEVMISLDTGRLICVHIRTAAGEEEAAP